jgi:predicted outer membrane repeat protein
MMRRPVAGLAAGTLLLAGLVALGAGSTSSGGPITLVVDTTVDDGGLSTCTGAAGDCSLRGAFPKTPTDHPGQPVTIQGLAGECVLDDLLSLYKAEVTVSGAGVGSTIVRVNSEDGLVRHLELNVDGELDVTLTDMTFIDGSEGGGGSILSRGGASLTVARMHFVGNEARGSGGAIEADGGQGFDTRWWRTPRWSATAPRCRAQRSR